ncbi:helix-turn-helix domain-containing protein [Microvirga subterranea]|uniref:helix-turn-helix domain-containing protein n=1 Tax=Microvirga subterranea TaxID=186651 RepID=UPI0011C02E8C|nr:helix-turn-helix domain-containing protein [Microvirga subterranea]
MKVLRSTRFKLYPNQTRVRELSNTAGAARWIDNWGLAEWQARSKPAWLTEVPSQGRSRR